MENVASKTEKIQEEVVHLRDSASSFLMSAGEVVDMIGGQCELFTYAGMKADFHIIDESHSDLRSKKIDCLYSENGKPYQSTYIIKMPSKLGTWLANFRGREPQAHVSYDFRQISAEQGFDFAHAAFDETLDREVSLAAYTKHY